MLLTHPGEMTDEVGLDDARQDGRPVLVALGAAHHDLVPAEVDVLDAKAAAFQEPESRSVGSASMPPPRETIPAEAPHMRS